MTLAAIRQIASVSRSNGARVVLMYIPGKEGLGENKYSPPLAQCVKELRIPFLNLVPVLRSRGGYAKLYYPLDGHLNRDGHSVVAESLQQCLARHQLIPHAYPNARSARRPTQ
jgi:lysophospholipase L1-like esterase